jgi:hypothetical protein
MAADAYFEVVYSIMAIVLKGLTRSLFRDPYLSKMSFKSFSLVVYGMFLTRIMVSDL